MSLEQKTMNKKEDYSHLHDREFFWENDEDETSPKSNVVKGEGFVGFVRYRIPSELIDEYINKKINPLQKALKRLEQQLKTIESYQITDIEAKKMIKKILNQFKSKGIKEVDIVDIHNKTRLPLSQINKIMFELEKEKKVKRHE